MHDAADRGAVTCPPEKKQHCAVLNTTGDLGQSKLSSNLCAVLSTMGHADIYTSRVCNLFRYTPYAYFRSPSQSLAHDRNISPRAVLDAEPWEDGNSSSGEASHAG